MCFICMILLPSGVINDDNKIILTLIIYFTKHNICFNKGRSTLTNLLESVNDWTLCLHNKQQVDIV